MAMRQSTSLKCPKCLENYDLGTLIHIPGYDPHLIKAHCSTCNHLSYIRLSQQQYEKMFPILCHSAGQAQLV